MPTAPPATAPVAAPPPPPRLGPWSRTWRYLAAVGFGLVLWLVVVSDLTATEPVDEARVGGVILLDLAVGVATIGLLPLRRRYPLLIAVLTSAATAFSGFAVGPAVLATVSLSTRRRWREVLVVGGVWVASGIVYEFWQLDAGSVAELGPVFTLIAFGASLLLLALVVATGFYIGARRELLHTLRQRAEAAERAQESRAAEARHAERTRIAREMHDVLAHRISLVAMQAGGLAYREDLTRAQITASAETIRDSAHRALGELREVLGVLRADDETVVPTEHEAPQPTLAELPALLADADEAGTPARLDVAGLPGGDRAALAGLPETASRTAFRVLQEALTNARKHAPGQEVRVRLAGAPGERLLVEARNAVPVGVAAASPAPGAGLGLIGAAERAELLGGSLEHGVERDGRFAVRVWLPWPS
ncbi:sensor histidine kinase [Cellulomonas pakistanensis]|uniref:histidine kinase n=1 Tax=Cellulomonas pakistanensis TaxID=992287 RepID=A0A919PBI0_9CELL|nr:histidine kinase [Cellulomonas pakistanensis]GIG37950.1 two-component sensor histidine kinase [Cellulomonas pakistanensis]